MKILLLNYTDAGGGAAIAAYRLTKALVEHGVDAVLGVVEKKSTDDFVVQIPRKKRNLLVKISSRAWNLFVRVLGKFRISFYKFKTTNKIFHSTNLKSIIDVEWINGSDFDVVNLHWINNDIYKTLTYYG